MKTKLILLSLALLLLPLGSSLAQDPSPTSIFSVITEIPTESLTSTAQINPTAEITPSATLVPANTATPQPTPSDGILGNLVAQETTLNDLSIRNVELSSPVGVSQFRLQIPGNWALTGSNVLNLNVEYFENTYTESNAGLVSSLEVYLNGALVVSLPFDQTQANQNQTYPIPLPPQLLGQELGTYNFQVVFRAEEHCEANSDARVVIRSDLSYIHLEYQEKQRVADFASYPNPIYFGSLGSNSEKLWIILPPKPSLSDIQAGASVIMGLGNQAFNDFSLQLRTADQISTGAFPADANVILLGTVDDNPFIRQLYDDKLLPSTQMGDEIRYQNEPVQETEGILHLLPNPENALRSILVVTSQSEAGLAKAAFALTAPPSAFNLGGDTAIISQISPNLPSKSNLITANEASFADLGIESLVLNGLGETESSIEFALPYNHLLTDEAFLELKFRYSALLEPANGILNIFLNGDRPLLTTLLQEDPLAENTVGNTRVVYAPLTARDISVGRVNDLNFNLAVDTDWNCNPPDDIQTWLSIDDTSRFHLPRQIIPPNLITAYVAWFPAPFNYLSDLSDVLLVLPNQPSIQELEQTYKLLAYLAQNIPDGRYFKPQIAFGELPSGLDLADYHLIVIGRPSTNSIFEALNRYLPQPFAEDSDQPEQVLDEVSYRLPPEFDIGILQTLHSIWSPERIVFVVTGSSAAGQLNAMNMLISQGAGYTQLLGDVVFINGSGVVAVDSQDTVGAEIFTAIPDANLDATLGAEATEAPNPAYTVTPGPTPTQTPSRTLAPSSSPTPLVSSTPSPTITTPVPTFTPLPAENLAPDDLEAPPWINILVIITGVVMVVGILFGLFTFYRSWRRNRI